MTRKIMITVDVEAQPARAQRDHVKRLIWGHYPDRKGGIGEMMDAGDRYKSPIVMFLDYCERGLYGDDILDVAREVHRRGHDIQLHSHPEFLAPTFWSKRGLEKPSIMNTASADQANALVEYLCESQELAVGQKALGYRGGGYRYGPAVLNALVRNGVGLNSSYIAARSNQPLQIGRVKQFFWSNGCLEVPVSCINPYLNLTRDFDLNFNASAFTTPKRMMQCVEAFYSQMGDEAIAVMVMHSWSFSRRQDDGFFSSPVPEYVERFDGFLKALEKKGIQVCSTAQVLEAVKSGANKSAPEIKIAKLTEKPAGILAVSQASAVAPSKQNKTGGLKDVFRNLFTPVAPTAEKEPESKMKDIEHTKADQGPSISTSTPALSVSCNVCQTPLSSFEDFNGRTKARCPQCGSVERQRVFVQIYDRFLSKEFDLRDKNVLALSPSHSEKIIYRDRSIRNVVSCDIQPDLKTDIVADITSMPQVKSESFDCVVASYVLTCVHDLDAALSEIHRVLKPGGRFLFCDPVRMNAHTIENTDISVIASWYGMEAYEKYKIGSFRRLGDMGALDTLVKHEFLPKTFYGQDPITDTIWVWHSASKKFTPGSANLEARVPEPSLTEQAEALWTKGEYRDSLELHKKNYARNKAAISGYRIGVAYFSALGVDKDLEAAWAYLSNPLQDDVRYAIYYRGLILGDTLFSGSDHERAKANLEKARQMGVQEADAALTNLYKN